MPDLSVVPDLTAADDAVSVLTRSGIPLLLTVREVAALLRLDPKVIRRYCRQELIDAIRPGRVWRIPAVQFIPQLGATAIVAALTLAHQEAAHDRHAA
jgi:excisionase family DNA binding protein